MMLESPIVRVMNPDGQRMEVNATVTIETAVTTPSVINHPVTDTESPLALPANAKRFLVKARQSKLQIGFQAGGPYLTIPMGSLYEEKEIKAASTTLYLISSAPADTVDVIAWQ